MEKKSYDAERALLGVILMNSEKISDARAALSPDSFSLQQHALVFKNMCRADDNDLAIDPSTVAHGSGMTPDNLDECQYLGLEKNSDDYIKIIQAGHKSRLIGQVAVQISQLAKNEDSDIALEKAKDLLDQIQSKSEIITRTVTEVARSYLDTLEKRAELGDKIQGVPTGFENIDKRLNGIQPGNLVIVAARPSMGKSTYALNIIEHAGIKTKLPSLVFTMEMTDEQLVEKIIANQGTVALDLLQSGRVMSESPEKVSVGVQMTNKAPVYICERGGLTAQQVRSVCLATKRKYGLGLVMVDYIGLMEGHGFNKTDQIAKISLALKSLAKELKVPVIALSQLNRKCDDRPNKRPVMSDLRDSGAIEQDADIVQFLYRDDQYKQEGEEPDNVGEVITAKYRMGKTGTDYLTWEGRYSRYRNMTTGEQADYSRALEMKSNNQQGSY